MAIAILQGVGGKVPQIKTLKATKDGSYSVSADAGYELERVDLTVDTPDKMPEQEKEVAYDCDGSYEVLPDAGYVLSRVAVRVDTPDKMPEQEKEVAYDRDGSYEVLPDAGYVLSRVAVRVDTPDKMPEQEKSLNVTGNGDYQVLPDAGHVLSGVSVKVSVASGGGGDSNTLNSLIDGSITEIENGATSVCEYAFYSLDYLTSATFPNATRIGEHAFDNDRKLTSIAAPNVTTINSYAFNNCALLPSASFPKVTTISANAFRNCAKCLEFDFSGCTAVPTLQYVNAFNGINAEAKILVPGALYDEWIAATNWATYADYIEAVWDYTEGLAYEYNSDYGGAVVMGYGTWDAWSGEDLVIPPTCVIDGVEYNVVYIDYNAMQFGGMKTVRLPETIAVLNSGNFCYSSVTHLYIPFIRIVNSWCFSDQCYLKHVQFKEVEYIEDYCFTGCSGTVFDFTACTTVPTLDMEYGDPSTGFGTDPVIKVPASRLNAWKNATNWALYADYIVAG